LDKHEEQSKEVIQYVIEYLIYGDKHDSSIFDIFCEFNFMNEFIYLSNLNNRSINLQIIKSFSVLILNLTNTTTLYYIFSNNFINQIITNDYEKYDDDFLSYYVNFIKSLSLKIDTTTIQFFFHKGLNSFPLLQSALKLYNHNDPMIKNVVRNIILTVLKSIFKIFKNSIFNF
jgi:protein CLEC16A